MNQYVIAKFLADSRRYCGPTVQDAARTRSGKRRSPGAFKHFLWIPAFAEFAGSSTKTHGDNHEI